MKKKEEEKEATSAQVVASMYEEREIDGKRKRARK